MDAAARRLQALENPYLADRNCCKTIHDLYEINYHPCLTTKKSYLILA